jgi:cephalosporin-C deacetylase-like acetyl esterase
MKKILVLTLLLSCCLAGFAQIRGNEIRVMVTPNHSDWTYKLGTKCTFTVRVFKNQCLLPDVVADYEMGPLLYPDVKKHDVVLKSGELSLSGSLNNPGFYRLSVTAKVNGKEYKGLATAAYAPEQIKAITDMPSDFQSFWSNSIAEARQVPLNATWELLPARCTDKVNVYQVSFQNMYWGSRTYGILCMPKKEGQYPALLRVPGAGVRAYYGDVTTAEKGAITLEIGIHGIPVTQSDNYYDNLGNGALRGYYEYNMNNRDKFYYKRVFIGAVRAVDFICGLPQYNGRQLGVTGSSQGGALSVATAALDRRVTFFAAVHPALCDHAAALKKEAPGWPCYFYHDKNPDAKAIEAVRYYDTVNFAREVNVPCWFSWGYDDEVCAPRSMYACYNAVKSAKELHPYLETGHYWYQEQYDEWNAWLWKQMGLQ